MPRIVIFGNSGSGKSTLARAWSARLTCAHLDLDTIAWEESGEPPVRKPLAESERILAPFLAAKADWVIEGCYADLLRLAIPRSTEIVFLDPGVDACLANCRNRPREPHKYPSPEAQNANLDLLLAWVAQYPRRTDEFSLQAHVELFEGFAGPRYRCTSNDDRPEPARLPAAR